MEDRSGSAHNGDETKREIREEESVREGGGRFERDNELKREGSPWWKGVTAETRVS